MHTAKYTCHNCGQVKDPGWLTVEKMPDTEPGDETPVVFLCDDCTSEYVPVDWGVLRGKPDVSKS
jgi:hypothetical protein